MNIVNDILVNTLFPDTDFVQTLAMNNVVPKYVENQEKGNPSVCKNCAEAPFKDLHIYGRSEQMTTTGAQLLDLDTFELRQDVGATIKRLDDGGFLVDGTPEQAYEQYIIKVALDFTPGTYFVSGGRAADGCVAVQINILNADGTRTYKNNASFDVLGTEQEITLVIQSVSEKPINNYKIYPMINSGSVALPFEPYTGGKPSPSPDYPQEIQSAGDDGNLSVIVKNPDNEQMQSVSFSTPNGLPGIPVTSGGNYTDENGQQWVCDEVDLGRGVYVKRVYTVDVDGANVYFSQYESFCNMSLRMLPMCKYASDLGQETLAKSTFTSEKWKFNDTERFLYILKGDYAEILNESCKKHPGEVIYALATPIETPLTASEIAAYKSLRTYRGTTIVEAEDKAGIYVKYNMPMPKLSKNGALRRWFKRHPII